jgi:hypothetical protein
MKTNEKQKDVIDILKQHVMYWESSNDISSPTHSTDLEFDIDLLVTQGVLTYDQRDELYLTLQKLLVFIQETK